MDQPLTLPGVMQFLRTEWQKHERQNIEWEMDKAQMMSTISKLENSNRQLTLTNKDLQKQLQILNVPNPETSDEPANFFESVSTSKEIVYQCINDIQNILKASGVDDTYFSIPPPPTALFSPQNCDTFSLQATSVTEFQNQIVYGNSKGEIRTLSNELIFSASSPIKFLKVFQNKLLIYAGGKLIIFNQEVEKEIELPNVDQIEVGDFVVLSTVSEFYFSNNLPEFKSVKSNIITDALSDPIVTFSMSSKLTVASTKSLVVYDLESGLVERKIVIQLPSKLSYLCAQNDLAVLGSETGDLQAINLGKGEVQAEFTSAHRTKIIDLQIVDLDLLLCTSLDGKLNLWSLPSLLWQGRLYSHDSAFGIGDICSNPTQICVAGNDHVLRVYRR